WNATSEAWETLGAWAAEAVGKWVGLPASERKPDADRPRTGGVRGARRPAGRDLSGDMAHRGGDARRERPDDWQERGDPKVQRPPRGVVGCRGVARSRDRLEAPRGRSSTIHDTLISIGS